MLPGHFGSFPEPKINVLHSVYPPAHALAPRSENKVKTVFLQAVAHILKFYIPLNKSKNLKLMKGVDKRWKGRRAGPFKGLASPLRS